VDILLGDLRYAVRMMWRSKVVTAVAIASLAAGIGANSAIASLVNAFLLRPRPVANPEELVEVYAGDAQQPFQTLSYPTYLDYREGTDAFTGLAAYGVAWQFKLSGSTDVEQLWGEVVSGNYFDVLGVRPVQGRGFLPAEDEVPGRNPVVVIGHGLWQRRFGGDPAIVGRTVTINGQPLTVVGVAPPTHTGMLRGLSAELWVPAMTLPVVEGREGAHRLTSRGSRWVTVIGRLAPGRSIAQARSQVELVTAQVKVAHPDEWHREASDGVHELHARVLSEWETRVHPGMRTDAFALAGLLLAIVTLVLLLAGINLASMLFARAVARRSEIAIRLALGAGRARIVRQLLTESVLLALIAGVCGVLLAVAGMRLLTAYMPPLPEGIRLALDVQLDWRVVAYTMALATVTGLLLGLAPALHGARGAVSSVLRDESSGVTATYRRSRLRTSLLTTQVALALVLLVGAGLVLRSLENIRPASLGFRSDAIVLAQVVLEEERYDRAGSQRFYEELSERVRALPGVRATSLVEGIPGGFLGRARAGIGVEGYTPRAGERMEIDVATAGPQHFTTLGVPLVAGRDFEPGDRDGAPCVAIVNEAFARRYLTGSASPIGRNLVREVGGSQARPEPCRIVGMIRDDAWQSLNTEVRPFFSLPLLQTHERRMTLMVHTAGEPGALVPAVRETIRAMDPQLPGADVRTIGDYFGAALHPFRVLAVLIGGCGVLALLLAAIGVFGVVSHSVAQRRREVGIRMALGALRSDILALVIRQGMAPVAYGVGAGLLLGATLTRVLVSLPLDTQLLFGVSPTDPFTFGGVTLLLVFVALVACWVPARRAVGVDPMVTLREGA
jgi:predicted permease